METNAESERVCSSKKLIQANCAKELAADAHLFCMQKKYHSIIFNDFVIPFLKQVAGVEPVSPAWEASVLPMNHTCVFTK